MNLNIEAFDVNNGKVERGALAESEPEAAETRPPGAVMNDSIPIGIPVPPPDVVPTPAPPRPVPQPDPVPPEFEPPVIIDPPPPGGVVPVRDPQSALSGVISA